MRAGLFLAAVVTFAAGTANAETRVAFSQKLGVEVLADGPDWCSKTPALRIVGQNARVFGQPDFAALVRSLGSLVLARQCPAAQDVRFVGTVRGDPAIVWRGSAAIADQWVLHLAESKAEAALSPGSGSKPARPDAPETAPPAVPAPLSAETQAPAAASPPPVSPLVGEWSGLTGCSANDMAAITISVLSVDGAAAHAYVQIAPPKSRVQAGLLRFRADGSFDAGSGQFVLRPDTVIRANGDRPPQLSGTIDPGAGIMALQGACFGNAPAQPLSQSGTAPVLARRIMQDLDRRAAWAAEAAARPHTAGRLVGAVPRGDARQPSCEELLAWAMSYPLDLRVRLLDGNTNGILRQYDDVNSSRVFGTAAYYWFTTDSNGRTQQTIQPREVAARACASALERRDPRFNALMQVTGDGTSMNALAQRQRTDELAEQLPIQMATTGGVPSEMYRDLAALTQADTLTATFQSLTQWNAQMLNDANRAQIVSEAVRLRALLAGRAATDARTAIAGQPGTEAGLAGVDEVAARFAADFPDDAGPIREAGAAKRAEIAQGLATDAITQIQAAPKTLDGLSAVRAQIAHLKAKTGRDLPDEGAAADAALMQFQEAAIPVIVSNGTSKAAEVPATTEGAQALSADRDRILQMIGPDGGDQVRSYRAAIDARLGAIGKAEVEHRGVEHGAGNRPHGIERHRQREDAGSAETAPGRFQPNRAGHRGGNADTATGIGAKGAEAGAGRDGGGRSTGTAAGNAIRVPRVARRRADDAGGELLGHGFAEHDRAIAPQRLDGGGIARGRRHILPETRIALRRLTGDVEDVLHTDRDAEQRGNGGLMSALPVRLLRQRHRFIGVDRHVGMQDRFSLLQPVEHDLHEFDRGEVSRVERAQHIAQGERECRHRAASSGCVATGQVGSKGGAIASMPWTSAVRRSSIKAAMAVNSAASTGKRSGATGTLAKRASPAASVSVSVTIRRAPLVTARPRPVRRHPVPIVDSAR